jgi:AcrR family transcriptional regulator
MDGRVERGDRSRKAVAARAAAIALGVSKSSIQSAYGTKEDLQLAAVAAASEIFVSAVVAPALERSEGLPRLQSLVDSWLDYVERRVFPGGCFMVATLSEFDSRPGPVRDALARARRGWLALLKRQADIAQTAGDVPSSASAEMLAFEIDALLTAANVARNLGDDTTPLAVARALIALRLGEGTTGAR